jgi:hypothetical protein
MLRGTRGCQLINPAFSNPSTIWWMAGPLAQTDRCISAEAGGWRITSVQAWNKGQVVSLARGTAGSRIA